MNTTLKAIQRGKNIKRKHAKDFIQILPHVQLTRNRLDYINNKKFMKRNRTE